MFKFLIPLFFSAMPLIAQELTAFEEITYRAEVNPLNVASSLIFLGAIIHTLCARRIATYSKEIHEKDGKTFTSEILRYLGEIEIIFGLWVIPLLFVMSFLYGWGVAIDYLQTRDYSEAIAVTVILTISSSSPIVNLVERGMRYFAKIGNFTVTSWWFSLIVIGPILGSFITEAGAIIVTAMLLAKKVFSRKLSSKFAYATLGLLFTNISIGGLLTNFASPPVLIVSSKWQWDTLYMLINFGWKSVLSILISTFFYYLFFKKELKRLGTSVSHDDIKPKKTSFPITAVHILFLIFTVINIHESIIVVGLFVLFMYFVQVTRHHQSEVKIKPAVLVGFFLAGLVIHGGLQGWWIAPLLHSASASLLLTTAVVLGPFFDNAALAYLATLIPNLSEGAKYAFMVGATTAGGLTIIANAPNPAGYQILSPYFSKGISAKRLFLSALIPMGISIIIFLIF